RELQKRLGYTFSDVNIQKDLSKQPNDYEASVAPETEVCAPPGAGQKNIAMVTVLHEGYQLTHKDIGKTAKPVLNIMHDAVKAFELLKELREADYHKDVNKSRNREVVYLFESGPHWDVTLIEGFPTSVTPDYVTFQIWDSLQALLSAIGVGEKSATVIGVMFQWFLRDFTGMLGGILFTFYQGSSLDSNAKMWRLVSDLMNDLVIFQSLIIFFFVPGDTLGSFIYVPCEVMKQRMQVQGTKSSWSSSAVKGTVCQKSGSQMYAYYTGMFQAGGSIFREQGLRGLYAGYWSTLARDIPFTGLMFSKPRGFKTGCLAIVIDGHAWEKASNVEELYHNGLPYGIMILSCHRYNGLFRGSVPRIRWCIPASALTFMAVEFLRDHFNGVLHEVANLSIEKKGSTLRKTMSIVGSMMRELQKRLGYTFSDVNLTFRSCFARSKALHAGILRPNDYEASVASETEVGGSASYVPEFGSEFVFNAPARFVALLRCQWMIG
ncbi:hypothetical protein IFM89_008155, partial [Coptis chinensis]